MIGIGILLVYTGYQNYRVFSSEFNPLFNVSPDSDIKAQFIFGVAAVVSGFVGFIRERVF